MNDYFYPSVRAFPYLTDGILEIYLLAKQQVMVGAGQ
jgi:hypothetical protein